MPKRLMVVVVAGAACCAAAQPEKQVSNGYRVFDGAIGQIYYNVATGEMIRTQSGSHRDGGNPMWVNEDADQCGFGEWAYYPVRDDAIGRNLQWMDWGDITNNSVIDCMTFLYVTTVPDPEEDGEDGYAMVVSFLDGADWCCDTCGWYPYLTWELAGIPGTASNTTAWLITVDFADTPENWFEIGDVDGIDDAGSGLHSGYCLDTDGMGNGADFGYAFRFDHPAAGGATGCFLVAPPERVEPNSLGSEDVYCIFLDHWNILDGFYWFGGYDCSGGAGYNWRPWADYYIGLYGNGGTEPNPCLADVNDDNVVDFFDVQRFLGWFSNGDMRADWNHDLVLNFFDVQAFLNDFAAGGPCP